jgi:hypothetical protein
MRKTFTIFFLIYAAGFVFMAVHLADSSGNGLVDAHGEISFPRLDSLNVRLVGSWPFGFSYSVAFDSTRNLAFLGCGGGVYVVDASVPSNPILISLRKHFSEIICGCRSRWT